MASASASEPAPLPSLPPSPARTERDLADRHDDDDPPTPRQTSFSPKAKGKQRADTLPPDGPFPEPDEYAGGDGPDRTKRAATIDEYPPTTDEAAEARRIEENLRRWEAAERAKRRAARDKDKGDTTSIVGSVLRRVSLLRSPSQQRPSTHGPAAHRALGAADAVPLDDIDGAATPRSSSPFSPPVLSPPPTAGLDNPFTDAAALASSSSLMLGQENEGNGGADDKGKGRPPVPAPLNLPPPRTPPPVDQAPGPRSPPSSSRASSSERAAVEANANAPPVRWWHEVLCGCGEGPDRGGDEQAGKTNPLE
ncbi:hypothetical protein PENSPDRAFT_753278 [Peniophora sp. CONT]|nr:hypothetical protein PENSPDRAFT_753278 [Peniophora sp. CONT]